MLSALSITHPGEYFGGALAIGTCPQGTVMFAATRQLSYNLITVLFWDGTSPGPGS